MSDGPRDLGDACCEWQSWPLRARPLAGVAALAVMVVVSTLIATIAGHVAFGVGSLIVLFGSLNPFFSPTRFRMDDRGVEVFRWPTRKRRAWGDIRSGYVDRHGVTLSPFRGRSWLEPYRAVRLLFDDNRAAVLAFVRDRLGEEVSIVEVGAPLERG